VGKSGDGEKHGDNWNCKKKPKGEKEYRNSEQDSFIERQTGSAPTKSWQKNSHNDGGEDEHSPDQNNRPDTGSSETHRFFLAAAYRAETIQTCTNIVLRERW
jgi:hypothetical protein